jgi:hypothetical protein
VDFLNSSMNSANQGAVYQVYREIGKTEVDREKKLFKYKTIPGSRSMHSVRSVAYDKSLLLQCRDYSYFCTSCMSIGGGSCPNRSHVQL